MILGIKHKLAVFYSRVLREIFGRKARENCMIRSFILRILDEALSE
jgi:hypothetical protein